MALTSEQVAALAPDASALAAARKTAAPRVWAGLGRSDVALWGECKGSAVYQVRVALADLVAKCTCPSRKFPCKHSLGLLFLAAEGGDRIPVAAPPEWVTEWLGKRSESAEKKKQRAEKAAEATPPDAEQQAKRSEKRLARVVAGIEGLEVWLVDLARHGLAQVAPGDPVWGTQAARLVDAQAPGLAARVRRLGALPRSTEALPVLVDGLGRLALLARAARRLDALDGPLAEDVRAAVGWTLEREEVAASGERVSDTWTITGQALEDDDRFRTQRTWLRGAATGRDALVLQFAAATAPFPEMLLPGTTLDAELAFWPGAYPLRALVLDRRGEMKPLARGAAGAGGDGAKGGGIEAFLDRHAEALARQPWLERVPAVLAGVVPALAGAAGDERFQLVDGEGRTLPLAGRAHWKLFAVAGGHPVEVYGEWDGRALMALGAFAGGAFHALGNEGAAA